MGARSFDDEIAQVPSRDRADRYFAPNNDTNKGAAIMFGMHDCSLKSRHISKREIRNSTSGFQWAFVFLFWPTR